MRIPCSAVLSRGHGDVPTLQGARPTATGIVGRGSRAFQPRLSYVRCLAPLGAKAAKRAAWIAKQGSGGTNCTRSVQVFQCAGWKRNLSRSTSSNNVLAAQLEVSESGVGGGLSSDQ